MPPRTLAQGNTTSSPEALRVETNVQTVDRAVNTGEDGSMPGALTPEVATRPISKRDLQIFKKAFNAKMKNKPVRHDQGHVLLLSWAPALDDLKVKPEVHKLRQCFKDGYGFGVTEKEIEGENVQHQLAWFLSEFMCQHDKKNTLLIIYYAGHGYVKKEHMHLAPSASQPRPNTKMNEIVWTEAERLIKPNNADVLVVFDCCHAGGFGGVKVRAPKPSFEFIAACGKYQQAAVPGDTSFTSALIWALKSFKDEERYPFTSGDLVTRVKESPTLYREQIPELQRRDHDQEGIVWIAPVGELESKKVLESISEHRHVHHEYIDLRLSFYRQVKPEDAQNVAQHLSRLVNDFDDFAKHIDLINVSDYVTRYAHHWRRTTSEGRERRKSMTLYQQNQITTSETYLSESPAALTAGETRRCLDAVSSRLIGVAATLGPYVNRHLAPLGHTGPQPGHHFRMFISDCFQYFSNWLQYMAAWLRLPVIESQRSPTIKID